MSNQSRHTFIPYIDSIFTPNTLTELLEFREFYKDFGQGLVFIQNKKMLSDVLIEEKLQIVRNSFDIQKLDAQSYSSDSIIKRIIVSIINKVKPNTAEHQRKKPLLLLVETTEANVDVNKICTSISKTRQCGVWIRGYVRDLDPKTLLLFDGLLLFDMSAYEYEVLRTAIQLSDGDIETLREDSRHPNSGKMLFFLNDKHQNTLPFALKKNPILLSI